jgi:hypothetical protein
LYVYVLSSFLLVMYILSIHVAGDIGIEWMHVD